jgi:pyruvate,water dikinase
MALLQDYLDSYGWRLESWGLLHLPTWAENPRLPLMLIGRYVSSPSHSPSASIERSVKQREDAVRDVEARLSPEKLGPFHEMLAAAQSHVAVSEGRALWQLLTIGSLRIPMLALGRKLASRGALAEANDVFFLDSQELHEAAQAPTPAVRELASKRRADLERWEKLTPPPFIGAPMDPSHLPPELAPLFVLFFGAGKPDFQRGEIKGQSASQGKVRGRARVISDLADSERLQEGDILVCQMTAAPWTPLFAIAGAVVTDSGGVLSHSAICAREYAIPCVVATQIATHVIPDGAMIEVDGTAGIVRIEG